MKKQMLLMACCVAAATFSSCSKEDDAGSSYAYDRHFLKVAGYVHMGELDASTVASSLGDKAVIRDYSKMVFADHTMAYKELQTLADGYGTKLTGTPDSAHVRLVNQLRQLSGRSFDSVFIHAQVKDHQDAILLFREELERGTDPAMTAYATKYLAVLQQHLQTADSIAQDY